MTFVKQTTLFTFIVVSLIGCGTLQIPTFNTPATQSRDNANQVRAANQSEMIADFEQKIAAQLLASAPELSLFATRKQTAEYAQVLKQLVNQSGLNPALLTTEQKRTFNSMAANLTTAEFRLARWQQLNHLSDLEKLSALEAATEQDYERVKENLSLQVIAGANYPKPLLNAAWRMTENKPVDMHAVISSLTSNANRWAQAKLAFAFNEPEQQALLGRLRALRDQQRGHITQLLAENNLEGSALYADPYYDVNHEADPPQIALDLLAINLEEALRVFGYQNPVAIEGIEIETFSLQIHSTDQVTFNLDQLRTLPAFEYPAIAHAAAARVITPSTWPLEWQESMSHGLARWLGDTLEQSQPMAWQARFGLEYRTLLSLELAVAELELSLGLIDLDDVADRLSVHLPYSASQRQQLLLNWYASRGSAALGMLIAEDLKELPKDMVSTLLNNGFPASYSSFKESLVQQLAQ